MLLYININNVTNVPRNRFTIPLLNLLILTSSKDVQPDIARHFFVESNIKLRSIALKRPNEFRRLARGRN